jgi:KaiC/GvpD/RAD55 family RecA-like ATPase
MIAERAKTGITGLDDLIEGGLPRGYSYALIGGPGTGKTTFGTQFLYKGSTELNEPGLYITFDEPPFSIVGNMRRFNWNLTQIEKDGKLMFIDASPIKGPAAATTETFAPMVLKQSFLGAEKFKIDEVIDSIKDAKRKVNAQRAVIDSVSALTMQFDREHDVRLNILRLIKELTEMGLTTILLSENPEEEKEKTKFGPDAFLAQGVIVLHMFRIEESNVKALEIRKMRGVKHIEKLCPYRITADGIEVYPEENVFR